MTVPPILAQTVGMTGDQTPSPIIEIMEELSARGVLITNRGGEWCVNLYDGTQATEYLTDDLQEALEHGRALAAAQMNRAGAGKRPKCVIISAVSEKSSQLNHNRFCP